MLKKNIKYIILFIKYGVVDKFKYFVEEYNAYLTKKKMWNHAWSITYRFFVKCIWPVFVALVLAIYGIINELCKLNRYGDKIHYYCFLFIGVCRSAGLKLIMRYDKFANTRKKYIRRDARYFVMWVVVGFILRLFWW